MIIHPATVELHPNDLRALLESGLPLDLGEPGDRLVPIGRADLATRLDDTLRGLNDIKEGQEELSKRLGEMIQIAPK